MAGLGAMPGRWQMSIILVVDDQPVNRQFLATLLGYFGHKALEAGDGVEALESLRNGGIDLVITDVLMPTMDGYDFLQRLRADEVIGRTPVIFYTGATYESKARAMAETHGVRHFLEKPAEPQAILAAVNSALGKEKSAVSPDMLNKLSRHPMKAPADPIDPNAVVFVVDDDADMRLSMTAILSEAHLKTLTFPTAEDFLEKFEAEQPGCLVLDLHLQGISGLELLEKLRSRRIHIPVIVVTGCGNTAAAVDAMRLRILDFLEKPVDDRVLLAKIYRALQEDTIRRREHAQADVIRRRLSSLTAREKDLVTLLVLGKTSKEIAAELHISAKTVSHHRAHLMAKTGAANLADLVRMTILVSLDK